MPVPYSVTLDQASAASTLTAGNDLVTLTSHVTRSFTVREFEISGLGVASAANEMMLGRVTTLGATAAGVQTPGPLNTSSAATAGFTAATGWTTQPVLARTLMRHGINANGALFRWVAAPGLVIDYPAGAVAAGQMSYRAKSGTSAVAWYFLIDEN